MVRCYFEAYSLACHFLTCSIDLVPAKRKSRSEIDEEADVADQEDEDEETTAPSAKFRSSYRFCLFPFILLSTILTQPDDLQS